MVSLFHDDIFVNIMTTIKYHPLYTLLLFVADTETNFSKYVIMKGALTHVEKYNILFEIGLKVISAGVAHSGSSVAAAGLLLSGKDLIVGVLKNIRVFDILLYVYSILYSAHPYLEHLLEIKLRGSHSIPREHL